MTAREAALRSLLRIEKEGRYSNLEADATLKQGFADASEARLYTRLVYGTIERGLTLDYILAPMMKGVAYEKADPEVRQILRLSAYQILFADRIPESAAVNEGVNLCKKYKKSAFPMVNAILRRLCREKEKIVYPDKEKHPVDYLSAYYGVSKDICALFERELGFDESTKMLEKMNTPCDVTLRVNTLKISREEFIGRLNERGIYCEKTPFSDYGVRMKGNVGELPELSEGLCYVQDEASQLSTAALEVFPQMTVMDICACPGGKSFGAAMEMKNEGKILSFDLHKSKLSLIKSGAERLGISVITAEEADGRIYRDEYKEIADRVICDVPCSGLGVISKKPDLRYKREEEISKLPEIQRAILDNACRYVKKGGRLVYSTCTVLKRENEAICKAFLEDHQEFSPAGITPPHMEGQFSEITLYPHIHGTDGFFIAAFVKK